jgi:glutathione S-transferase
MYVLHYAPDNASLIVRLALEEIGAPYRTALVDRTTQAQDGAAYRRLNPQGLVPVLETPKGAIFETGAILLWLTDRHGTIGPSVGDPARGDFLKWLFYLSNTVHADLRALFYPHRYAPPEGIPAHHAMTVGRLTGHFGLLNQTAAGMPELFGAGTALGYYIATLMRWSALYPEGQEDWFDLRRYSALARLAAAEERRPASRAAIAAEGLGDHPFTQPTYASPPKGSAT